MFLIGKITRGSQSIPCLSGGACSDDAANAANAADDDDRSEKSTSSKLAPRGCRLQKTTVVNTHLRPHCEALNRVLGKAVQVDIRLTLC